VTRTKTGNQFREERCTEGLNAVARQARVSAPAKSPLGRVPAVILDAAELSVEAFQRETGWVLRPEGACRGAVCVPLPPQGPTLNVEVVAEQLGMALVRDERHGLGALGPPTISGRALESAEAPDFTLPDLDGRPFRLGSLRGRKVVLVAWASW
jgi:hypothetical protein